MADNGIQMMTEQEVAQLSEVFRRLDKDGSGLVDKSELREMLDRINYRLTTNRSRDVEILLTAADRNQDGHISWAEFLDTMARPTNQWGLSNYNFHGLVGMIAKFHKRDIVTLEKLNTYKFWPPPIFMVIISIVQLGVFLHFSAEECDSQPTLSECPKSFSSKLAYRMCCREQVWRFFSYALVHAGWGHLLVNITVQLIFGVYLEILHGPFRVFGVYVMGALAGSLTSSVADPTANVVGASGSDYALVGAWVAHMIQNWDTTSSPMREVASFFLFVLIALDFGNSVYQRYKNEGTGVSYAGHFGGFIMGMTLGTYMLKNLKQRWYEIYVKWFGVSVAMTGIVFAILFNSFNDPDENNLCPSFSKC
eukprot:m.44462 g.44462  ORF g.44462 m.44462 type:complete len:365 (-) comp15095_c0_seq1:164-1258(-)